MPPEAPAPDWEWVLAEGLDGSLVARVAGNRGEVRNRVAASWLVPAADAATLACVRSNSGWVFGRTDVSAEG